MALAQETIPTLPVGPLRSNTADSCEIMGPAGALVQLSMGVFSFLILAYKRTMESPKREWKVWALDTSKQAISAGLAHILNVISAVLMSSKVEDKSSADSCAWYLVTMLFDTTVGSCFNIAILIILEKIFTKRKLDYLKSGNYFTEKYGQEDTFEAHKFERTQTVHIKHVYIDIDYLAWTLQLIIWCSIVSCVKVGLFFFQTLFTGQFGGAGIRILQLLNLHGFLKLVFVLVIVPTAMNSVQFWVTDNFLKKKVFTEKEMLTKSLYFKMNTKDKKIARSVTNVVKGKSGDDLVVQISKDISPRGEEIHIARLYKPPEEEASIEKAYVDRRVKSV